MKLSFIVIGVQKGGTTSLDTALRRHPQVGMGRVKEIHFFDDEDRNWRDIEIDAYHAFFDFPAKRQVYGEVTPNYICWPPALERIARYNPDIKIIAMFRDPIHRAYSHWQMTYSIGMENHGFALAIREGRKRLPEKFDGDRVATRTFTYVERGYYGTQLQQVLSLFPRKNVLLLKSEKFFQSQANTIRQVHEFLGIDTGAPVSTVHEHKHSSEVFPTRVSDEDVAYLREELAEEMQLFARLSGMDISDWLVAGRGER